MFRRWFDYSYHSTLVDLSDEPLIIDSNRRCEEEWAIQCTIQFWRTTGHCIFDMKDGNWLLQRLLLGTR